MLWKAYIAACILGADCSLGVSPQTFESEKVCLEWVVQQIKEMRVEVFPRILVSNYKCVRIGGNYDS